MATQFTVKDGKRWKAPFFTIWSGQALSLLGSQLVQFALIWYLTIQTGSATVLAAALGVAGLGSDSLGVLQAGSKRAAKGTRQKGCRFIGTGW